MSHDGDAADAELLARGEHARLLAKYEPVILARCVARLHGSLDAEDVAQDVKVRLWKELAAGKTYPVPYRVVVHQVIGWTLNDHFAGRPTDVPLGDDWNPADPIDEYNAIDGRAAVTSALGDLSEGVRRAMELRYLEGLNSKEIAGQLGIKPNAVDKRLHDGRVHIRKTLTGG
jgi:RNA polymerase sigma-70 factor (ECF subfamily)